MQTKRSGLFYDFYQNLSERHFSIDGILRKALPMMADYMDADKIYFFDWSEEKSIISMHTMCKGGICYYLQEDIFVDKDSPEIIKFLQDGVIDSPTLDYPAVYGLVKWRTPLDSLKTLKSGTLSRSRYGVVRVERLKQNKPFTVEDREILTGLCRELSVKINMTEVDHYNTAQLRRAQALNELARVFATSLRLSDSLSEIVRSIQKTFHFDRTSLYLTDPQTGHLDEAYSADISGEVKTLDSAANMHKKFIVDCGDDSKSCPLISKSDIVLTLPLALQNKNLGWLVFDNILSRVPISEEDILSLKQFSTQVALAIDNARLFEKVQELSNYDELTKLCLRRYFNENLAQEIYRSKRFNLTFSLILMDLDHFKNINDTYGHILGDEALKAVSEVIRNSLRQTDIPCRYGGDEILILLPRTNGEEAKNIARRLSERVRNIELPKRLTRGEEIKLTISQGISVYPYDSEEPAGLIDRADEALYHVKEEDRGFWALYGDVAKLSENK